MAHFKGRCDAKHVNGQMVSHRGTPTDLRCLPRLLSSSSTMFLLEYVPPQVCSSSSISSSSFTHMKEEVPA